jgi:uncharacterized surface protein with fasciclin (FAS1) repeats
MRRPTSLSAAALICAVAFGGQHIPAAAREQQDVQLQGPLQNARSGPEVRLGASSEILPEGSPGFSPGTWRETWPNPWPNARHHHPVLVSGARRHAARNLLQNASNATHLTTFVAAIKAAGLADTLEENDPLTVFAPTNAAFEKLSSGIVDKLMAPDRRGLLAQILTYHIVAGRFETKDLADGAKLKTVQGEELTVRSADGKIMIIDANDQVSTIAVSDIDETNGVIHMVDTVLIPKAWAHFFLRY